MTEGDTVEWQAHCKLVCAVTNIHEATTLLLRAHNAGQLRCLAEDLGAHRNALQRLDDALSRYIARIHSGK